MPGFMTARHNTRLLQMPASWQRGRRKRLAHACLGWLFRRAYRQGHRVIVLTSGTDSDGAIEQFITTLPLLQQQVLLRATHLDDALALAHEWADVSHSTRAYVVDFKGAVAQLPL